MCRSSSSSRREEVQFANLLESPSRHLLPAILIAESKGKVHLWAAMSLGMEGQDKVIELCEYLKANGVDFSARQKQGHSSLHKAASRKNRHVIEWLAKSSYFSNNEEKKKSMCLPDIGKNLPSDIWLNVGGEKDFGLWMKDECGC